jgi:hypothetical protein
MEAHYQDAGARQLSGEELQKQQRRGVGRVEIVKQDD